MKKKILTLSIIAIIVIVVILLAVNVNEQTKSKFNIVTSFYPMYIATLNITDGVDDVQVSNLTKETTGCIHDYVLTTTELVTLTKADVLVINGAGMESFMDKVISNFKDLPVIDSAKNVELIKEECHEHEHHNGHSHETNSHTFVSVKNYIKQVQNICDGLVKLDEKNKEKYELNTRKYIANLEELDNEIFNTIGSLENKNIITSHNSFEYFAREYSLNVVGIIESEHGKTPSAGEIAKIIETINEDKVRGVFVEEGANQRVVETILKEVNINKYILNPVTSGKNNKDEYINIMNKNLEALKEALS